MLADLACIAALELATRTRVPVNRAAVATYVAGGGGIFGAMGLTYWAANQGAVSKVRSFPMSELQRSSGGPTGATRRAVSSYCPPSLATPALSLTYGAGLHRSLCPGVEQKCIQQR